MRIFFKFIIFPIACMTLWGFLVHSAVSNVWFHTPIAPEGNSTAFTQEAIKIIEDQSNGNAAFILLENGKVVGEHYSSKGTPVDQNTLFQVASLSKWVSAWGVMALVDQGKLDLDTPVSKYLTRWQLPKTEFNNDGVTVRRLLSHTAGLTDGLGYGGYKSIADVQTIEASLTQAIDASPGADGRVRVGIEPGTEFKYSGGGYTLLQLLIEEVTGTSFETHMQKAVFEPLEMHRSTYVKIDNTTENLAEFYDADGQLAQHYRFTGLAPTSLYTTAADMTRFIQAHLESSAPVGAGSLRPDTVSMMRQPHASTLGAEVWGLGAILYAPTEQGEFIIGHDGKNEPAINAAARLNPTTGDAIIILETGNELLATEIAGEWTIIQTGKLGLLLFSAASGNMLKTILSGWLFIILVTISLAWRSRRKRP